MTLRTNITWIDTVLALFAGAAAGAGTSPGVGVIGFVLTLGAIGVWRAVRFLGVLVEQGQAEASEEEPV